MNLSLIGVLLLSAVFVNESMTTEAVQGTVPLASGYIYDATFIDTTPDFTDLYMIMTRDKARSVTIYCNARSCYRQRHVVMWV